MKEISVLFVCYAKASVGLGHLTRLIALAQAIKKKSDAQLDFLVIGEPIERKSLLDFNVTFLSPSDEFENSVKKKIEIFNPSVAVFDLSPTLFPNNLAELFLWIRKRNTKLIGIDSLINYCHLLNLVWVPSFYFEYKNIPSCKDKIKSGWDSFLIQKNLPSQSWKQGLNVLVLTGGSDVAKLGNILPSQLDGLLNDQVKVHWVQGPYAEAPSLPVKTRLDWKVHSAPNQLDELIVSSNYVLTVFGVSFFEVLQYGLPTVVFSPYGNKDDEELIALASEQVAIVEKDSNSAVKALINLMENNQLAKSLSQNALEKLSVNGAQKLAEHTLALALTE